MSGRARVRVTDGGDHPCMSASVVAATGLTVCASVADCHPRSK